MDTVSATLTKHESGSWYTDADMLVANLAEFLAALPPGSTLLVEAVDPQETLDDGSPEMSPEEVQRRLSGS